MLQLFKITVIAKVNINCYIFSMTGLESENLWFPFQWIPITQAILAFSSGIYKTFQREKDV